MRWAEGSPGEESSWLTRPLDTWSFFANWDWLYPDTVSQEFSTSPRTTMVGTLIAAASRRECPYVKFGCTGVPDNAVPIFKVARSVPSLLDG